MSRLDDAISHLASALRQVTPKDDAIIVGHVAAALGLLREERASLREQQALAMRNENTGGVR